MTKSTVLLFTRYGMGESPPILSIYWLRHTSPLLSHQDGFDLNHPYSYTEE